MLSTIRFGRKRMLVEAAAGFAILDVIWKGLLNRPLVFMNRFLFACSILLILTIMLPLDYRLSSAVAFGAQPFDSMEQATGPTALEDRFGIQMIYPSKLGGEEWFMNMNNPTSDNRFNPQYKITKNADGSWKMSSEKVRMLVYTREGYHLGEITHSGGQSSASERGFLQSPSDWKNVEITGYVKLNSFSQIDNFVWYARSGVHSDRDPCQGEGYKGNLNYLGDLQFAKEQWHVSYVKTPIKHAIGPLKNKWIGLKFVEYNYNINEGGQLRPVTKLELWLDPDADGKNWIKAYEGADRGQWGRTGSACNVRPDQVIDWGGPVATFRWDFAQDVDFKYLSVREIKPEGGNIHNIDFFTGTYRGHGLPDFGTLSVVDNFSSQGSALHNMLDNVKYYSTNSESMNKKVVRQGNNTYVVWVEGDEDNTDVYMKISHDNGLTFGNPINLSNNPSSFSAQPDMMINGTDVYVTWEDDDGNSGNTDILYTKSSDDGKSFARIKNLSNDPEGSTDPQLSLKNGIISVQWSVPNPSISELEHKQSTDGGKTFYSATTSQSDAGLVPQNDNSISFSEVSPVPANGTGEFQIQNTTSEFAQDSGGADFEASSLFNGIKNTTNTTIQRGGDVPGKETSMMRSEISDLIKKSELALGQTQMQGESHLTNGSKDFETTSTNDLPSHISRSKENHGSESNVDDTNLESKTPQTIQNTTQIQAPSNADKSKINSDIDAVGPTNGGKGEENVEQSRSSKVLKTDQIKNQTSQIVSKLENAKSKSTNIGKMQVTKKKGPDSTTTEGVTNGEKQDNNDKSITEIDQNHTPTTKNVMVKTGANSAMRIQLKGKDVDKSDTLHFDIVTKPKNGKITSFNSKSGKVIYEPKKDVSGSDGFRYTVTDGKATSKEGKVIIYIKKMDKNSDGGKDNASNDKDTSHDAREKKIEADKFKSKEGLSSSRNTEANNDSNVDG